MVARQAAVKKYIVTLNAAERERLAALIRTGKHSARKLLRARILLKADASDVGEAWTDTQIAEVRRWQEMATLTGIMMES